MSNVSVKYIVNGYIVRGVNALGLGDGESHYAATLDEAMYWVGQLIAPSVIQMLRAGEKSGKLGEVCGKISDFYEKKLENSIKGVMALIEPLMITILGIIIGTIAIALLFPVFRISTVIAH